MKTILDLGLHSSEQPSFHGFNLHEITMSFPATENPEEGSAKDQRCGVEISTSKGVEKHGSPAFMCWEQLGEPKSYAIFVGNDHTTMCQPVDWMACPIAGRSHAVLKGLKTLQFEHRCPIGPNSMQQMRRTQEKHLHGDWMMQPKKSKKNFGWNQNRIWSHTAQVSFQVEIVDAIHMSNVAKTQVAWWC